MHSDEYSFAPIEEESEQEYLSPIFEKYEHLFDILYS